MTYKEMKKRIDLFDKKIEFMYKIQKEMNDLGDRESASLCGDIISDLCGYKNYHIYEKHYEVVDIFFKKR